MNKALAAATLAIIGACLGACGSGNRSTTETIDRAEGEILDRSVTDDMLPYDTLRSQPPLADPDEAKKADAAPGGPAAAAPDPAGEAPAKPAGDSPPGESQPRPRPDAE